MKTNKGFIVPLLLGIIVLLVVGGGAYIYKNKKASIKETNGAMPIVRPQPENISTNTSVKLDTTNQYAQTYKTLFTTEFAKEANFDGHFRIVAPGCGSSCINIYALDKNTGKVYVVGGGSEYSIVGKEIHVIVADPQKEIAVTYIYSATQDKFQVIPQSSFVKISSLSLTSGVIGSSLIIYGSGFTGHDTLAWLDNGTEKGLLWGGMPASDSAINTTISEEVTIHAGLLCKAYTGASGLPCNSWIKVVPGTYKIYVQNSNGISNAVKFTVLTGH